MIFFEERTKDPKENAKRTTMSVFTFAIAIATENRPPEKEFPFWNRFWMLAGKDARCLTYYSGGERIPEDMHEVASTLQAGNEKSARKTRKIIMLEI
jgi:hypothetical protein